MIKSLLVLVLVLGACIACQPVEPAMEPTSPVTPTVQEISMQPTATSPAVEAPIPTKTALPTATAVVEAEVESSSPGSQEKGVIAFYSDRDGNPEIYTIHADGSGLTRLTNDPGSDDSPAISPDGRQIAFLTARHDPKPRFPNLKYEIYVMDVDGSNLRRLTDTEAAEDHPAWSPDGSKILFDADYDGDGYLEIYAMRADGTEVTRLTSNQANDQFADWSPDGSQIAFSSDRSGNWDLYVMNADGTDQRPLTNGPDWELFPAWSPDGAQIAFNGLVPRSRNTDVYVMPAPGAADGDGSEVRQLTDTPGFDENPTWSPDGTQIAFQTARDGNFEIYVMNADGSDQYPLAPDPAGELWPSWGPAAAPESGSRRAFEKSAQVFPSVPTWKIGLADLDADGDLDAVFANGQANDSQVWLNDGEGFLTDTGQQLGAYGHGVDVGDVDGDGDPDVVISTHSDAAPTRVYLNDGNAGFQALDGAFEANIGFTVELYDLDGDGDLDAVGEGTAETNVYWNDGTGAFTRGETTFPLAPALGDLDSDGDVDLFIKEEGVGYAVWLNAGGIQGGETGTFSRYWKQADAAAMRIGDVALGDVDGDGDLDVVVTNGHYQTTSQPAIVLMNDGSGQFTDSGQRLNAVRNAAVSLGDLDGDRDLDLVLTDYMEPCQVWLNDGSGQFADSGFRFGGGQFYRHAHLGDLDGDGDLDIFLATFGTSGGPNEIWLNQATAGAIPPTPGSTPSPTSETRSGS